MARIVMVLAVLLLLTPPVFAQQAEGTPEGDLGPYVVFFGFDSADLDAEAREVLQTVAEDYERTGATRVEVRSYADTVGSNEYNDGLSERRAEAVAEELIGRGVQPADIVLASLGESQLPVQTGEGVREPRNRRVEIEFERPPPPSAGAAPAPPPVEPAPVAAAPTEPAREPRRGVFSLGALYGFNLLDEGDEEEDDESHLAGLNISFDYVVADWVALSLEQAGFYHFSEDEGLGGRSAAGLNFTLGLLDIIPYIGGNIGYIYGSGLDDDFFAGPEVGLVLGPLNAKVAYDIPFDRDLEDGIIAATLGLGIRF
jgi:hypothetical protein